MDRIFIKQKKKILHSLLGRIYDVLSEHPNLKVIINISGNNNITYKDNSIFVSLGSEKYHKVINDSSIQLMRDEIVKDTHTFSSVGITLQPDERKDSIVSAKQIVSSICANRNGKIVISDHKSTRNDYNSYIPHITTDYGFSSRKGYGNKSPIISRKRKKSTYLEKQYNKRKNEIIKKILEQGNGTGTHTH